jgi:chorismate synthase
VAKIFLRSQGVSVQAWVQEAAGIAAPGPGEPGFDLEEAERNALRMPHRESAEKALEAIEGLRKAGDSAGGIVECRVRGLPAGFGEPVFDKLDALIAQAVLSVGAVKGVEFGAGFAAASGKGSELNDSPLAPPSAVRSGAENAAFATNHAGGVLGGLSTGMDLDFRAAFKPVPSISLPLNTVDRAGRLRIIETAGRHDVCICPRAVPVIEAMTALVLADLFLRNRASRV